MEIMRPAIAKGEKLAAEAPKEEPVAAPAPEPEPFEEEEKPKKRKKKAKK